ncbi:dihydrofolate reductase family protein [Oceanobacillus kimchii]|uniref:dihydrofolate reductase family protein n=1 Tax=Oceanobacillus TaxID=182709 RepID=UPI00084E48CD|nr:MULTISPECIES: dihydrofolate reductase family protein [Oceanobacillus]MCT1578920.1 dihydrofolate reductase family protein [Oceanobacillus kimchii]MCT2137845.1 dihydrofolate reductase family protein [Oceanobacillus kimchii]OEH53386.1 hypothetical protein AQ616_16940 [Oceanobacillus sp. E9]
MGEKRKVKLFIATSLDGYIATKNESIQWLDDIEGEGDNGYLRFYEEIDTVIMGNKTYQWLESQNLSEFPYQSKDCYVFSRKESGSNENVIFVNDDVERFIQMLQNKEGRDIWIVGGGELLSSFIEKDLIDEYIITVAPIILGEGIPLFKEASSVINLSLIGTQKFNQFIELHYERTIYKKE